MNKPIPTLTDKQRARFDASFARGDGCWNWAGATYVSGYGRISFGTTHYRAHRVAFFVGHGKEPGELCVCHKCDNPLCVNPEHLWLGTHEDNMRDMIAKGRAGLTAGCPRWGRHVNKGQRFPSHCRSCGHHRTDDYVSKNGDRPEGWRACRVCHDRRKAERRARAKSL